MSSMHDALRQFLFDQLGIDMSGIDGDSPLFSSGVIDSFSLVTLISHIEDQYGFRVGPTDVSLDNFDTLDRMSAYVGRMRRDGV